MIEQVGGTHYQRLQYQTWDLIRDLEIDYFLGNVIKYISRYKNKNGVEDLKKAKSYLLKIVNEDIKTNFYYDAKLIDTYVNQFDDDVAKLLCLVFTKNFTILISALNLQITDLRSKNE